MVLIFIHERERTSTTVAAALFSMILAEIPFISIFLCPSLFHFSLSNTTQ
jgi:hypothetical protein